MNKIEKEIEKTKKQKNLFLTLEKKYLELKVLVNEYEKSEKLLLNNKDNSSYQYKLKLLKKEIAQKNSDIDKIISIIQRKT